MMSLPIYVGLKNELPELKIGQYGYTTDTNELYVGTTSGNERTNWLNCNQERMFYEDWYGDEEVHLIEEETEPYVTEGLITLLSSPETPIQLQPSENYFTSNQPFTIMMTVRSPEKCVLLNQYELGGQQNRMKLERNWQNKITVLLFAQHQTNGQNTYPQLISPNLSTLGYTDSNSYLHIAIVRNNPHFSLYLDNQQIVTNQSMGDDIFVKNSLLPLILGNENEDLHIANFAYYNRALTAEELEQNYHVFKEGS